MTDLWRLSASQIADLVRTRKASTVEVVTSALARLDAVNPRINAVVDHRPEDALAQAKQVDARIAKGEDVGILAGVPVTVKINADQKDYATTNGVTIQKDFIAAEDNPVVENLRKAGAVIIGRTNAPSFSCRWFTDNRLYGRTLNPRNSSLTPGGSSGGAASAIAAGIGAIAHSTDIAGSIRYPAYACGVHGLRPSLGRVPSFNSTEPERRLGQQLMSVAGPTARSIEDIRLGLAAMSAYDPRDPWWVPAPLEGPELPRVAALCFRPGGMPIPVEIETALLNAAERMRAAGWQVDEIDDVPPVKELFELQITLWMADGADALLQAAEREGDEGSIVNLRAMIGLVRPVTLEKLSKAVIRRATVKRMWHVLLHRYPVVLLPTSGELPFPDGLDLQGSDAIARMWEAQLTQVGLPVLGLPSLSIAMGVVHGNPVGVQILAGAYREDMCLAAGAAIVGTDDMAPIEETFA